MADEIQITEKELDGLKIQVLNEKLDDICEQLGDPGRYFASFKAKDLLSQSDCEEIKSEKTSIERSRVLIEKVQQRRGRHNEHPYDVLVGALKRMRVHVHIVRILNTTLAAKREELYSSKRSNLQMNEFSSGFPSNGATSYNPPVDELIISKGPLSPSNTSSPISSSSSSHATTPPHLSSPQTDTDGSLLSPPSIPSSYETQQSPIGTIPTLPTLPVGYNELGQRVQTNYSRSNSQTTPIISEISNPIPSLPPGFGTDGKRICDISKLLSSTDNVHPQHGVFPPTNNQPEITLPQRSYTAPDEMNYVDENSAIINDLKILVSRLETDMKISQDSLVQCQCEITKLRQQNEELIADNKRLSSAKNHLESQMSILNGTSPIRSNNGSTPHSKYTPSGNWSSTQSMNPHALNSRSKRNTEPYIINNDPRNYNHRQSEPILLNIPMRPNKLPLNKNNSTIRSPNSQPSSYSHDHSPMYDGDTVYHNSYISRQSPGSDNNVYRNHTQRTKMTSSGDDLTSGGEDRNSVRSFESGNNVILSGQNTTETIV